MKKQYFIRIITIVAVSCLCFVAMQGCGNKNIDVGFDYIDRAGSVITGIKSDSKEFDIDKVTLDFYYGVTDEIDEMYGDKAIICLASCDIKEIYYLNTADYHNIDGLYIIAEKAVDELNNGPFDVEIAWGPKLGEQKYYNFKNTWTIPKEVFSENEGVLYYTILFVRESENNDGTKDLIIGPALGALINIKYTKQDEKVSLSAKLAQQNL